MTQTERRLFLIQYLLGENPQYADVDIPTDEVSQRQLLRALMNVRPAIPASDEFLAVQNAYLQEVNQTRGITKLSDISPMIYHDNGNIYLWRGDITTLCVDGIVNAANSGMTGCYVPGHHCIDNAIHTYAGVELRNACFEIIKKQGHEEETGNAKITNAYNLPSKYVIHTVGPIVDGNVTKKQEEELKSCYISCLKLANENGLKNIAFCCISTGAFSFPNELAAKIAVDTVREYRDKNNSNIEVIFNVFSDFDYEIYSNLLRSH